MSTIKKQINDSSHTCIYTILHQSISHIVQDLTCIFLSKLNAVSMGSVTIHYHMRSTQRIVLVKTIRGGINYVGNYPKTSYNNNYLFLYEHVYSFFGSKLNIFDVARNFSEAFLQENTFYFLD